MPNLSMTDSMTALEVMRRAGYNPGRIPYRRAYGSNE